MRYLVFVLLALAGCIDSPTGTEDQSNHTALDPAKEEFNRTYYSTIISIWERLIGGNYLYNATETENQYVYSVEAYVVGDNYSILYRIGRVPDIEVLAYRKNSEELYCIRLLGRFLNCTNSGQLLFTVLRDYGISDIRRYVFRDRVVIDAEERLVKTIVMSKNIQVQKDSDNKYILSYRPIDLNAQEMRVLGVSETSLETTDRVVQKLEMYNTSYRSEILIYPRNNSPPSNITITTEVSFNISDIPPLHIDFDRYNLKGLGDMLNILKNYLVVISGTLSESEIYKFAVNTRIPEYCIYTNNTRTCISYYVTLTGDRGACSIIGEEC